MSDLKVLNIGDKDEMIASLEKLKRNLPNIIEAMQLSAKIRRSAYLAFVAEGFTEEQALELVKGM